MTTGTINVKADNIFPIIKKFLYSEQEIFLRELISNAVDATKKLKTVASSGDYKDKVGNTTIDVVIDKEAKTLTVKDKGIGMTGKEVEKYINEIALSGAEDFVKKYKDKAASIIGHFGLGFYSSFMVADKVEIFTKTCNQGKAVRWECDGSPEYTLEEIDRKERGTDVVLHISEDAVEYLEETRISTLLKKYCKFLPVEIKFNKEKINNTKPAWTKKPAKLEEKDYKDFYKELYPYNFEEPLFHIHLNVDYPFNLTGILYFPKLKKNFEAQRDKIQLYCNQVFVTDSIEGIVPDFLTLLHGVIDSPDIPLNVSRSYLQGDPNVKKISGHITKKVADMLEDIFKNDRKDFESKWEDVKIFIEYGMLSDEKFFERADKFSLYKNTDGKYFTMEEYTKKISKTQKDKDKKLVYLYATNAEAQHSYIEGAKERGYDVLLMDSPMTSHLVGKFESRQAEGEQVTFARVDSEPIDKLINKEEVIPSKLSEKDEKKLKPVIEGVVPKEKFIVQFESMSEKDRPVTITQPEFARRMKDMNAMGGGPMMMGDMPEMYNLVVNSNHPLVGKMLKEKDKKKQGQIAKQAIDLALLSQNMLTGEELTKFINRSLDLIK